MLERHATPLVAIDLWVRAGAREERADESGCAHFLEHTLFKATTTRGPGEVDNAIESLGGTLDASTGPDFAHYHTTVPAAHLSESLAVLADVIRNATLPTPDVERERGVILDELASHNADPAALLMDLLYTNAFAEHPYRRSPGGTAAAIRSRSRDMLAAFYRRTYTPGRCTLVLVGDLTWQRALEQTQSAFGNWAGTASEPDGPLSAIHDTKSVIHDATSEAADPAAKRTVQATAATTRPWIGFGFRSPAAEERRMACAAQVAVALLGTHEGGRFAVAALSGVDVYAHYTPRQDASLFMVTAALAPPAERGGALAGSEPAKEAALRSKAEAALRTAVGSLRTAPPSLAELNSARRRLLAGVQRDLETNDRLAGAIGYAAMANGDTPDQFRAQLQQLTPVDIQQFARRYLDPDRCLTVRLSPPAAGTEAGTEAAP